MDISNAFLSSNLFLNTVKLAEAKCFGFVWLKKLFKNNDKTTKKIKQTKIKY